MVAVVYHMGPSPALTRELQNTSKKLCRILQVPRYFGGSQTTRPRDARATSTKIEPLFDSWTLVELGLFATFLFQHLGSGYRTLRLNC